MNRKKQKELIRAFKEKLPDVPVLYKNKIYTGHPSGRLDQFCTIIFDYDRNYKVSWDTITRCYNENRPVRI